MVYKYRSGYNFKGVDAQLIGETIAAIAARHQGRIVPATIVEESESDDAPLHDVFTWDDAEAARLHREDEARRVIRCYVVVERDAAGNEHEEIANVSIRNPFDEDGPAYVAARTALEDRDLRARIVELARSQIQGWMARYRHLEELSAIVDAIEAARAAEAARQPAPAPPRPRARGRRDRRAEAEARA